MNDTPMNFTDSPQEHNWSRNILVMQIESRLMERSGRGGDQFRPHAALAAIRSGAGFAFVGRQVLLAGCGQQNEKVDISRNSIMMRL